MRPPLRSVWGIQATGRGIGAPTDDRPFLRLARELELRAWVLADSLRHGGNPSALPGRGIEVARLREYQPGDEARDIDWRVSARRGRPFVKEYAQETESPVLLVFHRDRSLWAGRGGAKAMRAAEVLALLAAAALRSGDRVGLHLSGIQGEKGEGVQMEGGRRHLSRILHALVRPPSHVQALGLEVGMRQAGMTLKERSRVFLVGSFQLPEMEIRRARPELRRLADRHTLVPVRIRDREEGKLPPGTWAVLQDTQTGRYYRCPGNDPGRRVEGLLEGQRERVDRFFESLGLFIWNVDVDLPLLAQIEGHLRVDPGSRSIESPSPVGRTGPDHG